MTWAKVGDICHLVNGRAFKPSDWGKAGVPIIRIQNLNGADKPFNYWSGTLDRQVKVRSGDVLLAWSGTPETSFGVHIWDRAPGILNQHIFRVDLDEKKIMPRWFMYAVNGQLNKLIAKAHGGVGLQHVTRPMVDSLEIPLPPLDEQRRIAAILDKADALRRKRKRVLNMLGSLTQSIFLKMFGDPIDDQKYSTRRLNDLVDSDRGISYGIVQRGEDREIGTKVLRISDIVDGHITGYGLKQTAPEIADKFRRTKLAGGEIAISIRGTVGRCAVVPSFLSGANVSREIAVIPTTVGRLNPFYLSLIRTDSAQRRLARDVKGVAQSGINLEDLRELPIIQPPESEIDHFLKAHSHFQNIELKSREQSEKFEFLSSSLQTRAFSGQL